MKGKWGSDLGLSARMVLTMILLGLVYVAFIGIILLYVQNIAVIVVFVALFLGAQYYFSDRVVLATSGAHIVSEGEAPELHSAIERLCAMADLPKPKVAIANSAVPNAFATGRNQNHAVVAVTSSLLQRLEETEVEAVLAHELSHVKNRDMLVMTIASFVTTIAGFLMRFWFFMGVGGNRRDNNIFLFFIALAAIWIISFLITRALSRYREYAADRGSAIITAHPANLASALLKISGYIERVPTEDIRKVEGISQFFIIPAISRGSVLNIISTHPPIEKRIERLRQMEAQLAGQTA
ncbi:MAG TPA: zinc metalloprotease HtpX [Candidatus Bathyarchaeia archaeon]|nr:zinc metalloprotease HtpX [Candidatus Bathyarchaeia archaeon]